jgi:hypothetical protein
MRTLDALGIGARLSLTWLIRLRYQARVTEPCYASFGQRLAALEPGARVLIFFNS